MVGLSMLYLMITLYQTYKYVFYVHKYYDLEHWWSLASSWLDDFRESLGQPGFFIKKKINDHRLNQFYKINHLQMLYLYYLYLYCIIAGFQILLEFQFGKFSFNPSFIEHMVLLTLLSFFFRLRVVL